MHSISLDIYGIIEHNMFLDLKSMSQNTIQCRLVASVVTRQQLWKLMADNNTPLINELLLQVAHDPDFETW
ncbi:MULTISPECIES: hypothetical protein [unclassified Nostoc]|uniref:hypothetical protein n=1 Tax=unclassified Nostoc TaxID=2593658 RepID=UPI002FF4BA3F